MQFNIDPQFSRIWLEGFQKPERLSIPEWCKRYITLPPDDSMAGAFDPDRVRYLLPIFEALLDSETRIIAVRAAVQMGKSLLATLWALYSIANSANNIIWLSADEDLVGKFVEQNVASLLTSTEPIRKLLPTNKYHVRKTSIVFPHCHLTYGGANKSNVNSLRAKFLVGDECHMWANSMLSQFMHRSAAYPTTRKVLLISTAGEENEEFSEQWNAGDQCVLSYTCPSCKKSQELLWTQERAEGCPKPEFAPRAGINWKEGTEREGEDFDVTRLPDTVRLDCRFCNHGIKDTPANRRLINEGLHYTVHNPNAPRSIRSFTFNSLARMDNSFAELAAEYIAAKRAEKYNGNREPIRQFTKRRLALTWNPSLSLEIARATIGNYDPLQTWDAEKMRFLGADVQQDCLYYVIRAFSSDGASRLLDCGKVDTFELLREKQIAFGVIDQNVGIDISYNRHRVLAKCAEYGHEGPVNVGGRIRTAWFSWIGLQGSDAISFPWTVQKTLRTFHRYFSQEQIANVNEGTNQKTRNVLYFKWSNPTYKDILDRLFKGRGKPFLVPKDNPEYTAHLNAG
jgi:hypothetical protein